MPPFDPLARSSHGLRNPRRLQSLALFALLLLVVTFGCKRFAPGPVPALTPTAQLARAGSATPTRTLPAAFQSPGAASPGTLTPTPPASASASLPAGAVASFTASPTAGPSATPTGTPTPCLPPLSWVVYTILPGDTLSSLAGLTGTTPEKIMQANCMTSDLIIAYETIHLPRRPPAPPVVQVQPGPSRIDECASIFSCANPELPPIVISSGGGNVPTFRPCTKPTPGAHIDLENFNVTPPATPDLNREIGEQTYFFACGFTSPNALSASITGPADTETLAVLDVQNLPNRDLVANSGQAQKVIPWYPICDLPVGPYTLTLTDGIDQRSLAITLGASRFQKIMVQPQSFRAGEGFNIFYCNYPSAAGSEIRVGLYYFTRELSPGRREYVHYRSWDVPINSQGWAQQTQTVPTDTFERAYHVRDIDDLLLKGEDLFWVIP